MGWIAGRSAVDFSALDFPDADIPEHGHAVLIVQLQPNRTGLGTRRVTRMLSYNLAIDADANKIVAALDVHRIPVVINLRAHLGADEGINAAGGIFVRIDVLD